MTTVTRMILDQFDEEVETTNMKWKRRRRKRKQQQKMKTKRTRQMKWESDLKAQQAPFPAFHRLLDPGLALGHHNHHDHLLFHLVAWFRPAIGWSRHENDNMLSSFHFCSSSWRSSFWAFLLFSFLQLLSLLLCCSSCVSRQCSQGRGQPRSARPVTKRTHRSVRKIEREKERKRERDREKEEQRQRETAKEIERKGARKEGPIMMIEEHIQRKNERSEKKKRGREQRRRQPTTEHTHSL